MAEQPTSLNKEEDSVEDPSQTELHSMPAKRDHEEASSPPTGSEENQPAAASNTATLLAAAAAADNGNEFPSKRPKREWLAFHGVKHSRVGAEYQVAVLPSIEKKGEDEQKTESSPTQEKEDQ
jgi:hypothetical protein